MNKSQLINTFNNLPFNKKLDWFLNLSNLERTDEGWLEVCMTSNYWPIFFEEDRIFSYFGFGQFDIDYSLISNILITDQYTINLYLKNQRVEQVHIITGVELNLPEDKPLGEYLVEQIQSCTDKEYILIDGTPARYNEERKVIYLTTGEEFDPSEIRQNPDEQYEMLYSDGYIRNFAKYKLVQIPLDNLLVD